jgi:hypothetical protein
MPEETAAVQHEAQVVPPGAAPHVDAIASQPPAAAPPTVAAQPAAPAPLPVVAAPVPVPAGPVTWPIYAIPAGVSFGVSPNQDGTSTLVITIAEGTDELVSKAYTSLVKGLNAGWKSRIPVIVGARGGTTDNLTGQAVPPPQRAGSAPQAPRPIAPPAVPPPNARRAPPMAPPPPPPAVGQPAHVPTAPPRPTNEGLSLMRRAAPPNQSRAGHSSASMARRPLGPVPNQGQGGGEGQ